MRLISLSLLLLTALQGQQVFNRSNPSKPIYLRSTSGTDTYVANPLNSLKAYDRGDCFTLDADTANTGTATINITSLGAKSILNRAGGALADNDITANKPIGVCYDGTQFIIQGDGGGGGAAGIANYESSFSAQTSITVTGATHGFGHAKLGVTCYDNASPRAQFNPSSITVNTTSFDVVISFAVSSTGACIINGTGGPGGGTTTNAAALTVDLPVFGDGSNAIKVGTKTGTGTEAVMSASPTIVTPTISSTGWTNANHAHAAANSGGTLDAAAIAAGTLVGARGGTNNGFMDFTGPATSLKTYTLPNASTTILTTNDLVTSAQGGTGANNTATTGRFLRGNGTNYVTSGGAASGTGTCTNQFARVLNDDAAPTCASVAAADVSDGVLTPAKLTAAARQDSKSITIFDPVTGDTNRVQLAFANAVTIQRVWCSVAAATSVTIQFDERAEATPNTAGTDVLTAALVCDVTSEATTAFANATIAANVPMNLQITAVSGTPGTVRIHVTYQVD